MKLVHDPLPKGGHRRDIEGLRAVAVIAVLLFHLGIGTVSGGFIGVDVFFVISGFLIGGIVAREVDAGEFAWRDYLLRRVRRIVPAMLLVLAVVTVVSCILLLPSELVGYSWSLGFSALFLGNFHFWLHRGAYAESEHEVLLHMWTLGVEAQFYVLLPLIVLALLQFGKTSLWVGLVALAIVSAVASMLFPSASFYTLPARLWEFLLGMMVAITPLPMLARRWVREGLALVGLLMIVYAATAFHADTPFPGWRAAIPCIGAAMIIAAGNGGGSMICSLLELPHVRFIGKISYSLYLWHWPVIVLLLLGLPAQELTWQLQLVVLTVSLILSILSWRYIEEPFRRGSFPKRPLILGAGAVTASLVAIAVALSVTSGWPSRLSEREQQIASAMEYPLDEVFRSGQCFIHHRSQTFDPETCVLEDDGRPRVLLIGDSHAAHLWPGLASNFAGSPISQVTASGCRPVLDQSEGEYRFCAELVGSALAEELVEDRFDLVILAGRWEQGDLPALEDTLRQFQQAGQEVLLVGPSREWAQFVPRLLVLSERSDPETVLGQMEVQERGELDAAMADLARELGVEYFSIHSAQCDPGCRYLDDQGYPTVVDNSHFTTDSSGMFSETIEHPLLLR